jgi:hypothetical protein
VVILFDTMAPVITTAGGGKKRKADEIIIEQERSVSSPFDYSLVADDRLLGQQRAGFSAHD